MILVRVPFILFSINVFKHCELFYNKHIDSSLTHLKQTSMNTIYAILWYLSV